MGSLLRSEEMSLLQMFLQTDSAYCCVAELGEIGLVQFRDLNPEVSAYQRKFTNELRRCSNMERILRYIENELKSGNVKIPEVPGHIPAPMQKDIVEMEGNLERLEEELLEMNGNTKQMQTEFNELVEMREAIDYVQSVIDEDQHEEARTQLTNAQLGVAGPIAVDGEIYQKIRAATITSLELDLKDMKEYNELSYITGTLDRSRAHSFERVLWRWCLGNVFVRYTNLRQLDYEFMTESNDKIVFVVFFFGDELRTRVMKICDSFNAKVYNCPQTANERDEMCQKMSTQIEEMEEVLKKTVEYREKVLRATAQNHETWSVKVLKMKAIYNTLNCFSFDVTQRCLIAECWIPTKEMHLIKLALEKGVEVSGSNIEPVVNEMEVTTTPPTYNKVNKFTRSFQDIVDAYGVADYREINPAPWTIITFPFIFAVMFGDAGHGCVMFLSALLFILYEQRLAAAKIKDEIFNIFFGGRYVILLMGLFSIYTGLIYNDIYSQSIHIFSSSWKNPYKVDQLYEVSVKGEYQYNLAPGIAFDHKKGPYPFGVDPVWCRAENKLNYLNPLKMKLSVIIGISQMAFGLALSIFNHIYFKSAVDILFVWIPQLLFLSCIFIYLCILILIKWIKFYVWPGMIFGYFYPSSNCAPSLLIGLINMFMVKTRDPGFVNTNSTCSKALDNIIGVSCSNATPPPECTYAIDACKPYNDCGLQQWYPNQYTVTKCTSIRSLQSTVELILLIIAIISIPVMLLVKPFIQLYQSRHGKTVVVHGAEGSEFSFGDAMVLQAIHTIEYCLGCISHTASYLRLWALSLAHAELSEVLWTMVFHYGLSVHGYAGLITQYIIFWAFALLTIAILILMEGLSAFLHALRLHWVEFQSKFYVGTGYLFEPFSFTRIMKEET